MVLTSLQSYNIQNCENSPYEKAEENTSLLEDFFQKYNSGGESLNKISIYRWVPLKPDFLGAWKSVWLMSNPAY